MSFVDDIKPVVILYVIGDTITTICALHTGYFYEANPVMYHIFSTYGYALLMPLKIGFVFWLYYVYKNASRFYWNITRYTVSYIGLLATVSNIVGLVIYI